MRFFKFPRSKFILKGVHFNDKRLIGVYNSCIFYFYNVKRQY